MQLTSQTLAEIIGPEYAAVSSRELRRRQTPRARLSVHGYLRLIDDGEFLDSMPVLISDISNFGVGFITRRPLGVGEEFALSITRRDGSLLSMVCVVRRCQQRKDGRVKIGASYVRELDKAAAAEKGGPAQSSDADVPVDPVLDKRRVKRLNCQRQVRIRICRGGQIAEPVSVGMRDFSPRGVAVIHDEPLDFGDQFLMTVRTKANQTVQMLYTVAHCRKTRPNVYLIGAEFTCEATSLS